MGIEYTTEGPVDPERHDEARELYEAEQEHNAAAPPPANDELRARGHWLIYFADLDMPIECFSGENAEQSARKRYEAASLNWDCVLFCDAALLAQVAARARLEEHDATCKQCFFQQCPRGAELQKAVTGQ